MKTTLNLCISPNSRTQGGFYRHQGRGPGWQQLARSTGAAAPVRPQKCGLCRVSTALLGLRTRRLLLRAVLSVPCQVEVSVSGFGPLVLTNQLSKVNGYILGL